MIYIKETDEELIKYELEVDKDKLIQLREEIIENCSEIEHVEYESETEPLQELETTFRIKNYYKRFTGKQKEYFEETKDIYKIEFDKYNFTPLVIYIDDILREDLSSYKKLESYKGNALVKENTELLNEAADIKDKIEKEVSKDFLDMEISIIKALLFRLAAIQETFKLNQNQQNDMNYYNDVIDCIKLKEVDRLDKETIKRVEEFQGISYTKKK